MHIERDARSNFQGDCNSTASGRISCGLCNEFEPQGERRTRVAEQIHCSQPRQPFKQPGRQARKPIFSQPQISQRKPG